jgi:hypothetical protein
MVQGGVRGVGGEPVEREQRLSSAGLVVGAHDPGDVQSAELRGGHGLSWWGAGRPGVEQFAGGFAFGDGGVVDGDRELVGARVGPLGERVVDSGELLWAGVFALGCGGDGVAQGVVVSSPGAL